MYVLVSLLCVVGGCQVWATQPMPRENCLLLTGVQEAFVEMAAAEAYKDEPYTVTVVCVELKETEA